MALRTSDMINVAETLFLTAQRRGDVFDYFAKGFRRAGDKLRQSCKEDDAKVIADNLDGFIAVSERVHDYYQKS